MKCDMVSMYNLDAYMVYAKINFRLILIMKTYFPYVHDIGKRAYCFIQKGINEPYC